MLENCCIWLVIYLNCTKMHELTNLKVKVFPIQDNGYPKNMRLGGPQEPEWTFGEVKTLMSRPVRSIVFTVAILPSSIRGSL
jgi:hypothetical protein